MKLSFQLTMPNNAAWDGKWTSEGKLFFVIREVSDDKADQLFNDPQYPHFQYDFRDGWRADVYVEPVNEQLAEERIEMNTGFCGYEWMVDSILAVGEILSGNELRERKNAEIKRVEEKRTKFLKISNSGVLDVRLVALMGGTTKANDRYKIGQFGTGLKYALAWLFRNKVQFRLYMGTALADISTVTETIGENEYEIVTINGERTSITTQMGLQWNAWMILRELWCNALDEGDETRGITTDPDALVAGSDGRTTFYIEVTRDIQDVLDNWGNYFIHDREPLFDSHNHAIYENNDNGHLKLYKNGVLIYQHPETPSLFHYDIKKANINELREFIGITSSEVFAALESPGQEVVNYFFNNVTEKHYEGSQLNFDWYQSFGSVWKSALGDRKVATIGDSNYYTNHGVNMDFSKVLELPKKVYQGLVKQFEGIGAIVQADDQSEFFEVPSADLAERTTLAAHKLFDRGYNLQFIEVYKFGVFRDISKAAAVNLKAKTLMLSTVCLSLSERQLIDLLVENNEHLRCGFDKAGTKYRGHMVRAFTTLLLTGDVDMVGVEADMAAREPKYAHTVDAKDDLPF